MSRRTKAMCIIGAVWLAAMAATVVAFVGSRRTQVTHTIGRCLRERTTPGLPGATCMEYAPTITTTARVFNTGGFWACTFAFTLAALVAVIIVHIVTARHD